jgi:ribosomal protein L7/L12
MAEARELLELKQRIALLETRLQQVFEHLGIAPRESEPSDPVSDPEIQDLLAKGNEAQAVKRYRELTGLGLAEAKDAIEQAQGGESG